MSRNFSDGRTDSPKNIVFAVPMCGGITKIGSLMTFRLECNIQQVTYTVHNISDIDISLYTLFTRWLDKVKNQVQMVLHTLAFWMNPIY